MREKIVRILGLDIGKKVSNFAGLVWKANFWHFFVYILGLGAKSKVKIFENWDTLAFNFNNSDPYSCFESNLNGEYFPHPDDNGYYRGIIWELWLGDYSLKSAHMMIRPNDFHVGFISTEN